MQYWPQNREQKRLTTAFLVGESVSYFAAPGALVLAEDYMPNQSKAVKEILAQSIIKPNIGFFKSCKKLFDGNHNTAPSENTGADTDYEEAMVIADTLVKFGVSSVAGLLSSVVTQKIMERALKVKTPDIDKWKVRLWDGGVHYGAVLLLGTALSGVSDSIRNVTSKTLQGIGMKKQDADNASFSFVYTVIPEMAGTATGYLKLLHTLNRGSGSAHL
jgi:hypothetical protein